MSKFNTGGGGPCQAPLGPKQESLQPLSFGQAVGYEPLMSVEEVANMLHLHPKSVMRMARESRIPAFKVGRYWLFKASLIDAWLATHLQSATANSAA